MRQHTQIRWLAGFGIALLVAGTAAVVTQRVVANNAKSAAKGPVTAASAVPLEFRPQEVVHPVLTNMPQAVEFSGPLVAPNTAMVRAKASGTLLALTVTEGARVAAGQTLGRIDLAEMSSRIAERSANIESARAAVLQAERVHASNERLAAQQFISPSAVDNSRMALDTARAAAKAAQASLDTTRVALRDEAITAPISGIVAKRHVLPGEKVSNEQQVLTIVDLSKLELAGTVATHEVSRLAPGMAVKVRVEGVAEPMLGRIARIAPAAEAGTRAIGLAVEIANPRETLRAGQYALATVALADPQPRLVLPLTAVGATAGQDHVWVIQSGTLVRRAVTLGRRDDASGKVEVLSGVDAQAQVLALRFDNLREGQRASVLADPLKDKQSAQPPDLASAANPGTTTLR